MRHVFICLCGFCVAASAVAKDPATDDSIEVIEARFGAFDQWVDLTEQLKAQVIDGRLDLKSLEPIFEGIEDPAPEHYKTLAVVYRHQAQVRLKMVASDAAATRWGRLLLPEREGLARLCVRLYLSNAEEPLLERTINVNQRFDFESDRHVSLSGVLRRSDSGTLRFEGEATHRVGSSQFDGPITIAAPLLAKGGALSGGVINCWVQFDRPSAKTASGNKRKRSAGVNRALERYETSLLQASREFEQQSESAIEMLMSELEKIRSSTSATEHFHVVVAFYGQNVSWIEVTDKVRKAIGKKRRWTADVRTEDWGEPAPRFGGPRTLLVAYYADGKFKFKSVYQGKRITLP